LGDVSLLSNIKDYFPSLKRFRAYLNTASTGLMPSPVYESLKRILEMIYDGLSAEELLDDYVVKGRREIAKLINGDPSEIAFTIQTTEGLKNVLRVLDLRPGDTILGLDLDFPTITSLIESLCVVRGCNIRVAEGRGIYETEYLKKLIDDSVRVAVISSVQWITGWRIDLREFSELLHERDALLIVDGVQHVGALKLDVSSEGVDVLCVGGEKWMLNPYVGSGFMYVRKDLLGKLNPSPYGILNREEPEGSWNNYWPNPDKNVWSLPQVSRDALKFEWGGGRPYMLVAALYEAARFINNVGIENIENHILDIRKYLNEKLSSEGYVIYGYSSNERYWSGITLVKTGMKKERELKIVEELRKRGIIVSYRGASGVSGIRVSTHLYNDRGDVDVLVEELNKLKASIN